MGESASLRKPGHHRYDNTLDSSIMHRGIVCRQIGNESRIGMTPPHQNKPIMLIVLVHKPPGHGDSQFQRHIEASEIFAPFTRTAGILYRQHMK